MRLKITPKDLPEFVLPNMTVDVSIEVGRAENALALPVSAVALQATPPFVLAVGEGGVLERRSVRVLGRNPDWVAVLDLPPEPRWCGSCWASPRAGKCGR